ncbi:hypothetical protein [Bacillus sp. 3255]|uniref:hypothetical protein n=1 Tax=Bacillus sp. 3255 TaxID=2817904 RepID=UPI00286A56FB|nr:hypothetical protein [Bacillus sp. 3255]
MIFDVFIIRRKRAGAAGKAGAEEHKKKDKKTCEIRKQTLIYQDLLPYLAGILMSSVCLMNLFPNKYRLTPFRWVS